MGNPQPAFGVLLVREGIGGGKTNIERNKTMASNSNEQQRQSRAGEWLDANPGGIIEVLDWRAVNR